MNDFKKISLNDPNNEELIEQQYYQDYLRKENSTNTNEKKENSYLKINKSYILALKKLPKLERKIFYLSIIKHQKLDYISNCLKMSKNEISKIKQNAINHFIENLKVIQNSNNKADNNNE